MDTEQIFFYEKVLLHPQHFANLMQDEDVYPINLEINPTNICNQGCSWCSYGYLHKGGVQLPYELIEKLIPELAGLGVRSITWTGGGEPTTYRHLSDSMRLVAQYGLEQGMNTNGVLLSDELQGLISQYFTYVRFSVDAGSAATYALSRRCPEWHFERVQKNIAALVERRNQMKSKLTIGFSFLIASGNSQEVYQAAEIAKSLGVDYFQVKPVVPPVRWKDTPYKHDWTVIQKVQEQMLQVQELQTERFKVFLIDSKFSQIKEQGYQERPYDACPAHRLMGSLGADGSLDLCCEYKGMPGGSLGNLHEQSFTEIWHGERRRTMTANLNVHKCPPLCKGDGVNRLFHQLKNYTGHKNFL